LDTLGRGWTYVMLPIVCPDELGLVWLLSERTSTRENGNLMTKTITKADGGRVPAPGRRLQLQPRRDGERFSPGFREEGPK
jgi:hypothetical protein